ncbi:MAG: XRE family transcriptional regulator [Kiritimatiellales bacterium]
MNQSGEFDFSVLRDLRRRDGFTIADLSQRTGISPAVISKLERNQSAAELNTLFRFAKAFGITAAELIALAESRTAHVTKETARKVGDFRFRQIEFANSRCLYAEAKSGAIRNDPRAHSADDYETCWVLAGKVKITLPNESYLLEAGDSVQFDTLFEHTYEVIEDCRIVIQHIRKNKRF